MEANTKKLKETEDEILQIASNVRSDILDDDKAIETLQCGQKPFASIEQQIAASEKMEKQIQQFRRLFTTISERAALLYFSVVDPMYQFQQAEHPSDQAALIQGFHAAISRQFYQLVSFSLFSRHTAVRIFLAEKKVTPAELEFVLSPAPSQISKAPDEGIYVEGPVLERAKWVFIDKSIDEC
jgi:hypothetical protein